MNLKTYWHTFFNSLSSPSFYLQLLNTKMSFSVRYFLLSYVVLSIAAAFVFAYKDVPYYKQEFNTLVTQVEHNYPADLTMKWDGETFTTTPERVIELPYPSFLNFLADDGPNAFGFIDTTVTKPEDISQHVNKSTYFVIGQHNMYAPTYNHSWKAASLQKIMGFQDPFEITQATLPSYAKTWRENIENTSKWIPFVFPFFFFIVLVPGRLLSLLLETLLLYFFIRLFSAQFPFRKLFQLGLHVAVVGEIISIAAYIYSIPDVNLFSITYWMYMCIIIFALRHVKSFPLKKK